MKYETKDIILKIELSVEKIELQAAISKIISKYRDQMNSDICM